MNLKAKALRAAIVTNSILFVGTVHAGLPDVADPQNAAAEGDYIGQIQGYAHDIIIMVCLVIGAIAFVTVATNMVATYKEIGAGKKTWGDMGAHGGMGVLLLVFVIFLITEASSIIF